MRRNLIVAAFVLSLFVYTWASTAAAQPVLEVTDSSNPIVEGIVELMPGDENVEIFFGIVPDGSVIGFELTFLGTDEITVISCTGVELISLALCPLDPTDFVVREDETFESSTEPFAIGSAVISVASNAANGPVIDTSLVSSISEMGVPPTLVQGQVIATVVPEPSAALAMGVSLATLGAIARWRRRRAKAPRVM